MEVSIFVGIIIFGIICFWLYDSVSGYMAKYQDQDTEESTGFYNETQDVTPMETIKRKPGRPRKVA